MSITDICMSVNDCNWHVQVGKTDDYKSVTVIYTQANNCYCVTDVKIIIFDVDVATSRNYFQNIRWFATNAYVCNPLYSLITLLNAYYNIVVGQCHIFSVSGCYLVSQYFPYVHWISAVSKKVFEDFYAFGTSVTGVSYY